MWIVYLSLIVIVASLAYLGWFAFKTLKAAKPTINALNHTVARVQQKTDRIKDETDKLTLNQQELMADINFKKEAVNSVVGEAKQTAFSVKKLFKFKPMAIVARKRRSRKSKMRTAPY
ncbi:DUF948 domain-containing protein [Neobacillus terrae]|uniref:DUF948 domain-containing protein n=1 Tax=Neobacillus terrae TaxID=3034837 RepID=UPI00140E40A7|nr:DUF948 domain-containing protein [Neobacillus terrae]NHM32687.1 DUF948 domain-containing protein [Neobacillus terrae]